MLMKKIVIASLFILSFSAFTQAAELSELALFNRCFTHITSKAPGLTHPLLQQVVQGQKTGAQACVEALRSAKLVKNGALNNRNDQVARDILNTFYGVHAQWFMDGNLRGISNLNRGLFDPSPGSLYLTKALFDPQFKYQDIFHNKNSFEAIRSEGRPTVNGMNRGASYYLVGRLNLRNAGQSPGPEDDIYWDTGYVWQDVVNHFPETGDLVGFRNEKPMIAPGYASTPNRPTQLNGSIGGGILGNRDYLMRTINASNVRSDGGLIMPRRFGRAIFYDFLCQELPVVNSTSDSSPYVDPTSSIPFRTNNGCVSCHVSMDQAAAIIRDYGTTVMGTNRNGGSNTRVHLNRTPSMTSAYTWPSERDANYYKKTYLGKFVYRTTDDKLVSKNIDGFNALGNIFKGLDDTYLCAATRYFQHFTNISYPITQISKGVRDGDDRAIFIQQLGKDLKQSQDPLKTLEAIINSSFYRDSNFGTGDAL